MNQTKQCIACKVNKPHEEYRLVPSKVNPNKRRNQCKECIRQKSKERSKRTGYWKNRYQSMSENERKAYIKKKSLSNQKRFKENPSLVEKRNKYNHSDKGVYSQYKSDCNRRGRLKRGIKMELSFDEFSDIINKKCWYCHVDNCRGVDRVDSCKSYTIENCRPCCKRCNAMKNDMTMEEFKEHIGKVYRVLNFLSNGF